jgi:hypothetical protein
MSVETTMAGNAANAQPISARAGQFFFEGLKVLSGTNPEALSPDTFAKFSRLWLYAASVRNEDGTLAVNQAVVYVSKSEGNKLTAANCQQWRKSLCDRRCPDSGRRHRLNRGDCFWLRQWTMRAQFSRSRS